MLIEQEKKNTHTNTEINRKIDKLTSKLAKINDDMAKLETKMDKLLG